ncbi:MAG: YceI family protein [Pseudomonadota bacterium]
MKVYTTLAAFISTLLFSLPAAADWALLSDESRIGFVSVKAGDFPESNYFRELQGSVSASGEAEITIPLDSVETNIDIRNERMRKYLFETETYPTATVSATVDLDAVDNLNIGARKSVDFAGELTLRGATVPFETALTVTRIGENRVLVETTDPIILFTDQFDLMAGIDKLKELAGLPSITPATPVTASIVFERGN